MGKEKIVIDTNIWISGLGWGGYPREVIKKDCEILTCNEQLSEIQRVLNYPKFIFTQEEKFRILSYIIKNTTLINISNKLRVTKDPDDNMLIETALIGGASIIVTGDKNIFDYRGIKVLTAKEFIIQHL
jgi:putative PIN family toxin of toxin-antitoxin system